MTSADITRAARLARERTAYRYTIALEAGDFSTLAGILVRAETDPALARIIDEINAAQAAELDLALRESDDQVVRDLLAAHLPSGQAQVVELPPLTVGAVVAAMRERVERYGQGGPDAARLVRRFEGSAAPLPERLSQYEVRQLFDGLGVAANDAFRMLFRDVAITLSMGRTQHEHVQLAAARRQRQSRRGGEEPRP